MKSNIIVSNTFLSSVDIYLTRQLITLILRDLVRYQYDSNISNENQGVYQFDIMDGDSLLCGRIQTYVNELKGVSITIEIWNKDGAKRTMNELQGVVNDFFNIYSRITNPEITNIAQNIADTISEMNSTTIKRQSITAFWKLLLLIIALVLTIYIMSK